MSRLTIYLRSIIPSATSAILSYYWLYIAGIVLPAVLTQLYAIRDGRLEIKSPIDVGILIIPILIQWIAGTLAYVDQHNKTQP